MFVFISYVECSPEEDDVHVEPVVKCEDTSEAICYIYEHLPEASLEAKCKRYVVMASLLRPKGRLHNKAVSRVMRMSEDQLNQSYKDLEHKNELIAIYMAAIDGFRAASVLRPPFIELIVCLKKFDSPYVKDYLKSDELNLIIDSYKKVLRSPDSKIDLNFIANPKFRRGFVVSMTNLFRHNAQYEPSVYEALIRRGVADASSSGTIQQVEDEQMTEFEKFKIRKEERLRLSVHRHREQERLRLRRQRILLPGRAREKSLFRQKRRRILYRQEQIRQEVERIKRQRQVMGQSSPITQRSGQNQQEQHMSIVSLPGPSNLQNDHDLLPSDCVLKDQTYDHLISSDAVQDDINSGLQFSNSTQQLEDMDAVIISFLNDTPETETREMSSQIDLDHPRSDDDEINRSAKDEER